MTLTEEQRGTVGFDLEKVREAVHTLENFAFASGKITAGQIQDVLWGARLLAGASTEIERMRTKVEKMEFLMRSTDDTCLACAIKVEVVDQQTTRIKELEDALAEERAKVIMLIEKLQLVANDPDWQSKGLKHDFDWYLAESKKQIESGEPEDQRCRRLGEPNGRTDPEGKIGPDASALNADHEYPPERTRSWQITDERKAALAAMSNLSETISCPDCGVWIGFADIGPHMAVLRAMLKEAGQ